MEKELFLLKHNFKTIKILYIYKIEDDFIIECKLGEKKFSWFYSMLGKQLQEKFKNYI